MPLSGGPAVALASGIDHVETLATASGSVYWSAPSGVWAMPGAGGSPTQISTDPALGFASDQGTVFAVESTPRGTAIVAETY